MTKLDRQIENLQTALDMLKVTLKGRHGIINLYNVDNDSRYLKQRADEIYYSIQEVLDKIGLEQWTFD